MKRVIVIGGGLAGLRAGYVLARAGVEVQVLERKGRLGGRAGSVLDEDAWEVIDTGQHVFLACYAHTRRWLAELGTAGSVRFQPRLDVPYLRVGGGRVRFRAARLPAPLHLLGGLAALPGLGSLGERLKLLGLARVLAPNAGLDALTVRQWEDQVGIGQAARDLVLEPLAIAALNDDPDRVSALPFAVALKVMLRAGAAGSAIGFAKVGLGDLYVESARRVIEDAGGQVRPGAWVTAILAGPEGAKGVRLGDATELEADAVLCTIPPWDLAPLASGHPALADLAAAAGRFEASPIVTVHLWWERSVHPEPFSGLVGGAFHWLFNRTQLLGAGRAEGEHLCLVKSGARDLLGRKPEELATLAADDVRRFVAGAGGGKPLRYRVVWETKATVSLAPGTARLRPPARTALPGLFLAGDWTDTGLPATIEGAVKSGSTAAAAVLSSWR